MSYQKKYRIELGAVYEFDAESNAYIFCGRMAGCKTLAEWIRARDRELEIEDYNKLRLELYGY